MWRADVSRSMLACAREENRVDVIRAFEADLCATAMVATLLNSKAILLSNMVAITKVLR